VDVVVFSAPQLSLFELRTLAALCDERRFSVPLLAVTSPQVKPDADRMGLTTLPMLAGFELDISAAIPDGAELEVDPELRRVTVLR
jgi:predicted aconitase